MPKMKSRKAVLARFKVTGRGKLLRTSPGKRHILTKKSSKRKRRLSRRSLVSEGQTKMYAKKLMLV